MITFIVRVYRGNMSSHLKLLKYSVMDIYTMAAVEEI